MPQVLAAPEEQGQAVPAGVKTDLVEVMLAEAPDVTHSLHIALNEYMQGSITPRNVLNGAQYLYHGSQAPLHRMQGLVKPSDQPTEGEQGKERD